MKIGSYISVDEVMIRFSGRSVHTYKIDNKPVSQGFKLVALCGEGGYTAAAIPMSRHDKSTIRRFSRQELSPTESVVVALVEEVDGSMPPTRNDFILVCDNYYTTFRLFAYLKQNNIGALGTCRTNRMPPKIREMHAKLKDLEWGALERDAMDGVLAIGWVDNAVVNMLSTVHTGFEQVVTERKRPRATSGNAAKVRRVFGENAKLGLPIPKMIDDYNRHMNHVDVSDQLRSYYQCLFRSSGSWWPLFLYILEVVLTNSYILFSRSIGVCLDHESFRMQVVEALISKTLSKPDDSGPSLRRSQNNEIPIRRQKGAGQRPLPECRFDTARHLPKQVTNHRQSKQDKRRQCYLCAWLARGSSGQIFKTSFYCAHCRVFLCMTNTRNCFATFHNENLN
jgi:hypothetical protein